MRKVIYLHFWKKWNSFGDDQKQIIVAFYLSPQKEMWARLLDKSMQADLLFLADLQVSMLHLFIRNNEESEFGKL